MTIGNSLWIGVSGLIAHGDAISTVGDNIANVSTIGFKKSRASFNDMLGGEMVGERVGGGVYLGANQSLWQQGTITQTGNPMDVAISGNGMFVVAGNHGGRDGQFYTRDGRFELNNAGRVVDQHGMAVQGYTVTNGVKSASIGNLDLAARQSPAIPTTKAAMNVNLNATDATPGVAWDPANPEGTSDYTTSVTIYDSLGAAHQASVHFVNNGAGGFEWHAMVDGGDLTGGTPGTPTQIASGQMQFNTDGALQTQTTATSSASFLNATPNQTVDFSFGDPIASGGTGRAGSSMFEGESVIESVDVDGRAYGNLTDVKINTNGSIEGVFDNGDTFEIAKLAIADFQNQEGLERQGDSLYAMTRQSGEALIDEAGTKGRGALVSGALEQSNVDLSTELVTLIAYQRAFQANSKTVTTADEMLSEVTNLKR